MEGNAQKKRQRFSNGFIYKVIHIIGWVFIGLGFAALFALVFGFVVKWVWNMLMPELFGLSAITFWQAFGIVILAKLLFGGFSPHRHNRSPKDYRQQYERHFPWKRFGDNQRSLKTNYRIWKYYHRFWQDEGETAFEAYMKRKEGEDQEKKSEESKEASSDKSATSPQ
jgi:hypothetical protein